MNKKIKNFVLTLLLCLTVVFVGCTSSPAGQLDTKANVNLGRQEDYAVATAEEKQFLTSFSEDNTQAEALEKYRLTVKMDQGTYYNVSMNGIIEQTQTGFNMAMKMNANQTELNGGATIYLRDRVVAFEYTGDIKTQAVQAGLSAKFKTTIPEEVAEDTIQGIDQFAQYDMSYILESLNELDFEDENVTINVNSKDNLKRFEIVVVDNTLDTPAEGKIYLVFEGENLIQCKFTSLFFGMNLEVAIESFDGEIEFPVFDNYTEISYEDYLANQDF